MTDIPLPLDENSLRAKMRNWGTPPGGRRLASASIGSGGLKVYRHGKITIGAGGDLEVVDGNLILGDGKISGHALKEHISVDAIAGSQSHLSSLSYNSWNSVKTISADRPAWANEAIILATCHTQIGIVSGAQRAAFQLTRIKIGNTYSGTGYGPLTGAVGNQYATCIMGFSAIVLTSKVDISVEIKPISLVTASWADFWNSSVFLSAAIWWVKNE